MKAIILNEIEYRDHHHRTRKAYRQLIGARNKYYWKQTTLLEFIKEVEIIIFNRIPSNDLIYLKDGTTGATLTIIKELIKSTTGGSLYRLKTDLLTVY